MLDDNGNLTAEATQYLSPEEIALFNAMPRQSSTWMMERQAAATRLLSAAMQRKALMDVEERGRSTTNRSNIIAALATLAVFLQVVVEVLKWIAGR